MFTLRIFTSNPRNSQEFEFDSYSEAREYAKKYEGDDYSMRIIGGAEPSMYSSGMWF
jgi:hypothetical protein